PQEGDAPSLDVETLNLALSMSLKPEASGAVPTYGGAHGGGGTDLTEEIAEDMLELLRRVKFIESAHAELLTRLERMEGALRDTSRQFALEFEALRRDLLGERKAMGALSVCHAVLPTLDSLRVMYARLHPSKDSRTRAQLDALIQTLGATLRGLGFLEFNAAQGEAFDPASMECLGFAEGQPGVVLSAARPGYRAGDAIVRPAGVVIAGPPRPHTQ
nr:nucleotide exchange factor GrpE [Acidobacteriota bacterium]